MRINSSNISNTMATNNINRLALEEKKDEDRVVLGGYVRGNEDLQIMRKPIEPVENNKNSEKTNEPCLSNFDDADLLGLGIVGTMIGMGAYFGYLSGGPVGAIAGVTGILAFGFYQATYKGC